MAFREASHEGSWRNFSGSLVSGQIFIAYRSFLRAEFALAAKAALYFLR